MVKQIVKKYTYTTREIDVQINQDLAANPTWTVQQIVIYPGSNIFGEIGYVVFKIDEPAKPTVDPTDHNQLRDFLEQIARLEHAHQFETNNSACLTCQFYIQHLKDGKPYLGDTPCQWCQHNPYKITCGTK